MRKFILSSATAVLLTTLAACSPATKAADTSKKAAVKIDDKMAEHIRTNLTKRLPDLPPIKNINDTPMAGLYEVHIAGDAILYTDAQGDYLIQGALLDTQSKRNLTEERMKKLNAIGFDDLPLKDAFVIQEGKGERQLAVFSDPNCPFCVRLEHELAQLKNIKIHLFLLPILGQSSAEKAQNVWCAKNRTQTWKNLMLKQKEPAAAQCDIAALQRNMQFARQHNITGTPTIIFANGVRHSGMLQADALETMIKENAK